MRIQETVVIGARPRAVWKVVGDPSRYETFMTGITRWEHRGGPRTGLGARYAIRMMVGSAEVGGLVEAVEVDEARDIAWHSITGIDHRWRWRLRERQPGCTTVTLRLSYQSPGGLLGLLADRASAPMVRGHLRRALRALETEVEGPAGERTAGSSVSPSTYVAHQLHAVRVLAEAGLLRPMRPDRLLATGLALRRWGFSVVGAYAASAARFPGETAIIDELGSVTFDQVERRTNALAQALAAEGIREGDGVGLLCRNHRGFVESSIAVGKLGANALYLNTGFAAPQLAEVMRREKVAAVIHDDEFGALLDEAGAELRRYIAWHDDSGQRPTLDQLIASSEAREPDPPETPGRVVILTSGTTGAPKGASRAQPRSADPAVALLSRIPLRVRESTLIAAPLFHAWGLAHFNLGLLLSSTLVLQRRFDPEAALAAVQEHSISTLVAVPVMLQRILDLPESVRRRYDTSSLRVVAVSGSALPPELATRFMDEFGDIVYNLYGSTEVAWATIATPEDMRSAPGTAGRPPRGTIVRILDERDRDVPSGQGGRIFVGNEMLFEGYTGGGRDGKSIVDGLMSTGDRGHFDEDGRLFVEGRDDDMIVSGGENVFPQEVEELLARHRSVSDAAVVGVDDEKFGQRLKAFVVTERGARVSTEELQSYVKSNLAAYKVPREVEFVKGLPRNPAGKVVKRELQDGNTGDVNTPTGRAAAGKAPSSGRSDADGGKRPARGRRAPRRTRAR